MAKQNKEDERKAATDFWQEAIDQGRILRQQQARIEQVQQQEEESREPGPQMQE